jgi:2-hydroxychromene-2-carboxylate isomerase
MPPVQVEFLFDFGSPNAYLCHKVIPQIETRQGVRFRYVPILLGGLFKLTNNRSPAEAFSGIANKRAYDALEVRRFVARHKLSAFQWNTFFPVNTLLVMRGAVAAQQLECFDAYCDAVYAAMWEQSLNMVDLDVASTYLTAAGLDAAAILSATRDESVKAQLLANTQQAAERGAFGSPTFFVGQEMFFGKDRLREVEEDIQRQLAGGG